MVSKLTAMAMRLPLIYPITDKPLAGQSTHLAILKELVRGGATLVQIRDKVTRVRELLDDLRRCVEFSEKHGVQLLINDRCDLALCSGAAGVHVGQDDLPPTAARRILGPVRIVGYSTHTLPQVSRSQVLPVDYIAFGPLYATSTKQDSSPAVGLARLHQACRQSSKPVVAIGGIGVGQIRDVLDAGAQSVAMISALMKAKHIARQMEAFLAIATERPETLNRTDRPRQ